MVSTLEFVKEKFGYFNELCFGKLLPEPAFKLSKAKGFVGQLCFKRRRRLVGRGEPYAFTLKISTFHNLPQQEVEDTIIHEMIHLYIHSNNLKDTSTHGKLFRATMSEINAKYGRHITISHKITKEEMDKDHTIREHFICIVELPDGNLVVIPSAKSRLFENWRNMDRAIGITVVKWIWTLDPFFNRYPRCITPKIYAISAKELEEHTITALVLKKEGNTISLAQ